MLNGGVEFTQNSRETASLTDMNVINKQKCHTYKYSIHMNVTCRQTQAIFKKKKEYRNFLHFDKRQMHSMFLI